MWSPAFLKVVCQADARLFPNQRSGRRVSAAGERVRVALRLFEIQYRFLVSRVIPIRQAFVAHACVRLRWFEQSTRVPRLGKLRSPYLDGRFLGEMGSRMKTPWSAGN